MFVVGKICFVSVFLVNRPLFKPLFIWMVWRSNDVTFYVLMANMYFEAGMLEDAERMRRAMKEMELKKTAGHSSVVRTSTERGGITR